LNKYDIAKEITITAIEKNFVSCYVNDTSKDYVHISEQVAENVAAFYNKLIEKLNIPYD
jgi:hypothetical protein